MENQRNGNNVEKQILETLEKNLSTTYLSEYCPVEHKVKDLYNKTEIVVQNKMQEFNGVKYCSICERDKNEREAQEAANRQARENDINKRKGMIKRYSLYVDKSLADVTLDSYINKYNEPEVEHNINEAKEMVSDMIAGESFFAILTGKTGSGKSHLAMAMLKEVSEQPEGRKCVFINVREMMVAIKNSFNDKESKLNREHFTKLCTAAEFVVLDDLGAEIGAIDTDKKATDFTVDVITGILDSRQGRGVILTSNLNGEAITGLYDGKIMSRMLNGYWTLEFNNTRDKRIKQYVRRSQR